MTDRRAQNKAIESLNHSLGLGAADRPSFEYPEDARRSPHDTHRVEEDTGRCRRCGAMDYWPAIESPCRGVGRLKEAVTLEEFPQELGAALGAFMRWWKRKKFDRKAPTLDEWLAQLIEWRRLK